MPPILIEPNQLVRNPKTRKGSQMSEVQMETEVLEQLARRYVEEQRRLKQAQASVDRLKKELREAVGVGNNVEAGDFTIEVMEVPMKRMMKKDDFIARHSPPRKDSLGNVILGANGEPLLDTDVGLEFYQQHLVETVANRFYVKQKPL